MINHVKAMKRKIFHANKVQEQIKMFENSPGYRNEVDIQKESKVTGDILSSAVKVANDLLALENDPCFLNEDQMKLLEDHVSIFLSSLKILKIIKLLLMHRLLICGC